ncbi:MAG: ribosomal-processing cysteine protease Prp [Eubacterium sp.]|nr:ribosomal-processing cysteine protease Prp [Eubacterium sp.]
MIAITLYRNPAGRFIRLHCIGHAQYADCGEDIVCAGVSTLVITTVNAIGTFTREVFDSETDRESGLIDIRFQNPVEHDAQLLLNAMVLGLQDIQDRYGTKYSLLTFKEV